MAADSMVLRANMLEAVKDDTEGLRRWLGEPEVEDLWKRAFLKRLKDAERDAVRLYAEARRMVNSPTDVHMLVINTVGAPASEARSAVDMVRRVRDASPDDMAREALGYLDKLAAERGQTRAALIASLAVEGP